MIEAQIARLVGRIRRSRTEQEAIGLARHMEIALRTEQETLSNLFSYVERQPPFLRGISDRFGQAQSLFIGIELMALVDAERHQGDVVEFGSKLAESFRDVSVASRRPNIGGFLAAVVAGIVSRGISSHLQSDGDGLSSRIRKDLPQSLSSLLEGRPGPQDKQAKEYFEAWQNWRASQGDKTRKDASAPRPGDVLFREGAAYNPFGHCGIYLGPPPGESEAGFDDHHLIEMTGSFWALAYRWADDCRIGTVQSFKEQGAFWGTYGIDLDDAGRIRLLGIALSFRNSCYYSLFNHKNPAGPVFRCDGYVEHCHEALKVWPAPLIHRRGLFEDDTYYTMMPASLRNAFVYKRN